MKKLETLGLVFVCVLLIATIVVATIIRDRDTLGAYKIAGWNVRVTRSGSLEVGTIPHPFVVKMKDGKIVTTLFYPVNHVGYYKITTGATPEWQAIYKKFFKT